MKKFVLFFVILALAFAFSGCGAEELPEENTGKLEPVIVEKEPEQPVYEENIDTEALYEEMILNFGAVKAADGRIKVNKIVSLYNVTEGFEDGTALDENQYFIWAMSYLNYHSGYEHTELFSHPEFSGWAYPAEYYEPAVYKFFGVPAEKLTEGELYFPEYDLYNIGGGGGIGNVPYIIFNDAEETEDGVILHLTMDYEQEYEEDYNMALTVKLLPEGGYNYISYMPE